MALRGSRVIPSPQSKTALDRMCRKCDARRGMLARDEAGKPFVQGILRFVRALIVGAGATLVDISVLTTCIRLAGLAPTAARLPALICGASVQFFGNRTYTFRAQRGSLTRQGRLFVLAELVALALNWSLYRLLVPRVHSIPPEIVSFFGTFVVFVSFAYPLRRWVIFRIPEVPS